MQNQNPVFTSFWTSESRVLRLEGEYSLPADLTGWTKIDEGSGDRFSLSRRANISIKPLYDGAVLRYKLVDGKVVERTAEEIEADEGEAAEASYPENQRRTGKRERKAQAADFRSCRSAVLLRGLHCRKWRKSFMRKVINNIRERFERMF